MLKAMIRIHQETPKIFSVFVLNNTGACFQEDFYQTEGENLELKLYKRLPRKSTSMEQLISAEIMWGF